MIEQRLRNYFWELWRNYFPCWRKYFSCWRKYFSCWRNYFRWRSQRALCREAESTIEPPSVCLSVCVSVCVTSPTLPVLQPKRQEIEKSRRNKKCSFLRCGLSSPRSFPPRPPPLPPRGGQKGEGVPRYSASATAKTTRDREKFSKQKMLLFALRFILLPGHFPLDPLPCPPEGGKWGRGSPRK